MKKTILAAILACGLALPAAAEALEKVWERDGFALPESVLWDAGRKVLYVSNINGDPFAKDGNGYISKLSADGKVLAEKWAEGLDSPKGMAIRKGRLYVSDLDRLVVIDTATGKTVKTYTAPGAKFLNDVTIDDKGAVFVSDLFGNAIWRLADGKFAKWLEDAQLENPNGLRAEKDRLVVAAWGPMTGDGFNHSKDGPLKAVTWGDKLIRDLGPAVGALDGLEADPKGGYIVSDWLNGGLFKLDRHGGRPKRLLKLDPGSADIGLIPDQRVVLVPMMMQGKVVAYRLP